MDIKISYKKGTFVEDKSMKTDDDFIVVPFEKKDYFDALGFVDLPFSISGVEIDGVSTFPEMDKSKNFSIIDYIFPFISFSICYSYKNKKPDSSLDFQLTSFKKQNLEKTEDFKELENIISTISENIDVYYFLIDLNDAVNSLKIIKKLFYKCKKAVFVLEKEKSKNVIFNFKSSLISFTKNKKVKNDSSKGDNAIGNAILAKEKTDKSIFSQLFLIHWGNFLFLFLHSVLITSFFLIGLPLFKQTKFFAIGILFVVIGSICFLLASTIIADFSSEINDLKSDKGRLFLMTIEFVSILLGIGLGTVLFFSLALNNVLVSLNSFQINSVFVLTALFSMLFILILLFKPLSIVKKIVNKKMLKIVKRKGK